MSSHLQKKNNLKELIQVENKLSLIGNIDKLVAHIGNCAGLGHRLNEICNDFLLFYETKPNKTSIEEILEFFKSIRHSEINSVGKIKNLEKAKEVLLKLAQILKSLLSIPFISNTDKREKLLRMIQLINPVKDIEDYALTNCNNRLNLIFNKNEKQRNYTSIKVNI